MSHPSPPDREPPRHGPDISAAQVAGSALAAVSAAVVASFLGVGGTVIGAALGSIVASVGGAVYSHSFKRAGDRLGETKVLTVVTRPRPGRVEPRPGDLPVIAETPDDGLPPYAESGPEVTGEPAQPLEVGQPGLLPPPGGRIPRRLSWKGALALTVVAFVVAIAAIEVVEVLIGRPISGGSGGTTISHLVKPGSAKPKPLPRTPKPTPSATLPVSTPTPSATATGTPTTTTTPSPTVTSPSASPTSTGPVGPTSTPTG